MTIMEEWIKNGEQQQAAATAAAGFVYQLIYSVVQNGSISTCMEATGDSNRCLCNS
jgi:hypothetical protein